MQDILKILEQNTRTTTPRIATLTGRDQTAVRQQIS